MADAGLPRITPIMYCKLFASLYQGTLRGRSDEILVFTNLLAHADKDGYVDKHFKAIAEETGIQLERVKLAIEALESSDPESRSPELEGARIERLDEHRVWGWRIVNYVKYRSIRNADDRREQNRLAQMRFRRKANSLSNSKPRSAEVSRVKPRSAHVEVDADADKVHQTDKVKLSRPHSRADSINEIQDFCNSEDLPVQDAEYCWHNWQENGWTNQGKPIRNWKMTIQKWKAAGFLPSQRNGKNHSPPLTDRQRDQLKTGLVYDPTGIKEL